MKTAIAENHEADATVVRTAGGPSDAFARCDAPRSMLTYPS